MKSVTEIDLAELKAMVQLTNDSGALESRIPITGVNSILLYNNFVEAIYTAGEDAIAALSENYGEIIDFYNSLFDDEEPVYEEPESELEEEDELNGLTQLDFENEIVPDELEEYEVEPNEIPNPEPEVEPENIEEFDEPKPPTRKNSTKRIRISKVSAQQKINEDDFGNKILTVTIKELNSLKDFSLPDRQDIEAVKAVRKVIRNWCKTQNMTKGQIAAVSKELNFAGYYTR